MEPGVSKPAEGATRIPPLNPPNPFADGESVTRRPLTGHWNLAPGVNEPAEGAKKSPVHMHLNYIYIPTALTTIAPYMTSSIALPAVRHPSAAAGALTSSPPVPAPPTVAAAGWNDKPEYVEGHVPTAFFRGQVEGRMSAARHVSRNHQRIIIHHINHSPPHFEISSLMTLHNFISAVEA